MDLVAGRTKFGGFRAHERLEERAAVRLGVQAHDKVMQGANDGIVAGRQFMQLRIFEKEVALAHGAFHFHDAVTHQAAQARVRFGPIDDFLDGRVEKAAVEQRGIVASSAPLRRLYANNILHVLDAFAIPLIIKR